jgi:hypothetical protein
MLVLVYSQLVAVLHAIFFFKHLKVLNFNILEIPEYDNVGRNVEWAEEILKFKTLNVLKSKLHVRRLITNEK